MGNAASGRTLCFTSSRSSGMCRRITCCGRSTGSSTSTGCGEELAPFYSEMGRPSIDPGADDPDADRRLLLRHPLGAAAVRGGPSQPGLPLVLPARARRRGARPLDLLEEPARPLPRQRSAAPAVRDRAAALHGRGPGRRRRLCGRCQPDQGRRQPAARRRGYCGSAAGCRRAARSRSIWPCSTMRRSARRRR